MWVIDLAFHTYQVISDPTVQKIAAVVAQGAIVIWLASF